MNCRDKVSKKAPKKGKESAGWKDNFRSAYFMEDKLLKLRASGFVSCRFSVQFLKEQSKGAFAG